MSKLILLNGPSGSGKSQLCKALLKKFKLEEARCNDKLFELMIDFFNLKPDVFWDIYEDRQKKETPLDLFSIRVEKAIKLGLAIDTRLLARRNDIQSEDEKLPLSCRQAMIYVSELICKPTFGQDYFGNCRAQKLIEPHNYIDDSCGFEEEIQPAIDRIGAENILLVKIIGRGTFKGDSRNYITEDFGVETIELINDNSLDSFISIGIEAAHSFLVER